jgi:hypothetical protein
MEFYSSNQLMNQENVDYIYNEYYPSIKRTNFVICRKQMYLEIIVLTEISQTKKQILHASTHIEI